jgi:murein DD-endopeptidase MepM/ murein hydrolase activator NlpD
MLKDALLLTAFSPIIEVIAADCVWIDLSNQNPELKRIDTSNAVAFSKYINRYVKDHQAKVAIGGYKEARNIYKRSQNFNSTDAEERFIHLGLDLWTKANTPIFAPLEGKVHSFKNNIGLGNYGPTIILEHQLKGDKFHTLYGHLTTASLKDLEVGKSIPAGENFAAIGSYPENGDYPPHLHFQVIVDLKEMTGDFPGVTSLADQNAAFSNCLDPNLILKF